MFGSGLKRSRLHSALQLVALWSVAAGCLCACATPENNVPSAKLSDVFATPDWAAFSATAAPTVKRAVTPNDLLTADGRCAAQPGPATDGSAQPESADAALAGQGPLPGVQGGVGLGMTECEVLQRTGMPERFDIGAEGTERILTMTVTRGTNAGLYKFRGGRLVSIDRIDVPAPPKTAKKSPAKKQSGLRGPQQ